MPKSVGPGLTCSNCYVQLSKILGHVNNEEFSQWQPQPEYWGSPSTIQNVVRAEVPEIASAETQGRRSKWIGPENCLHKGPSRNFRSRWKHLLRLILPRRPFSNHDWTTHPPLPLLTKISLGTPRKNWKKKVKENKISPSVQNSPNGAKLTLVWDMSKMLSELPMDQCMQTKK